MNILVGVDLAGSWKPSVSLLDALQLASSRIDFVSVVEPMLPDGSFPELAATHPLAQIMEELNNAAVVALDKLSKERPGSTSQVLFGNAGSILVEGGRDHDLVVVGSQHKSLLESFFAGSVTKALATVCPCSVLIGKSEPKPGSGLTVLVAHDLSDYSSRAIEQFVAMDPKGIARIVLVTADLTDPSLVAIAERHHPEMSGETLSVIEAKIERAQTDAVEKLKSIAPLVESTVHQGDPKRVIAEVAKDIAADLAVVAAQGHSALERLLIGSVAMHAVVREPYNVLLIRAKILPC